MKHPITLSLLLGVHPTITTVHSLSITESPRAQTARSRLVEAFRSPSKKVTLHPELSLPEPSDPTALLLRASEVTKLSQAIRSAKANAIFVEGTVDALAPMAKEQEDARGNFPGPLPIIYSPCEGSGGDDLEQLKHLEGVEGVMVPFFEGKQLDSVEEYLEEGASHVADRCGAIWEAGLQPIPEILLRPGSEWSEEDVVRLVNAVKDTCGGLDPVSIVFTNARAADTEDSDDGGKSSTPHITIPASISKRTTFIGSVRTTAGEGRMNAAVSQLSSRNFNGACLRADCVPELSSSVYDLGAVGGFWGAAIGDLKSLKSKNFGFRAKVKLENDVPLQWYNYQKDVMESGALGGPFGGSDEGLNPDAGDYKGF